MQIIAFTGKKGHGKSTACNKLKEIYGDRIIRLNFKDGLIDEMKSKLSPVLNDLSNYYDKSTEELFEEKPPVMRRLMQFIGTEVYREMDEDYWVSKWRVQASHYDETNRIIVVDDVRFKNEFEVIKKFGGDVYKVVALNKEISTDQHASETEMDSFDCEVIASNNAEELEELIVKKFYV